MSYGTARAKDPSAYEAERERLTEAIQRIDFILSLRQRDLTHMARIIGMLEEQRRDKQLQLARLLQP